MPPGSVRESELVLCLRQGFMYHRKEWFQGRGGP